MKKVKKLNLSHYLTHCEQLTLLTVAYEHKAFLDIQLALVKKLNPELQFQWIIAENSPKGSDLALDTQLEALPPWCHVIDGPQRQGRENPTGPTNPNYYHAEGLKQLLAYAQQQAKTRYIAVVDPDFMVVFPNWIAHVLAQMQQQQLAMFGSTFAVRSVGHYRYFPNVFFWVFDLDQFNSEHLSEQLDFSFGRLQARAAFPKLPWLTRQLNRYVFGKNSEMVFQWKKRFARVGHLPDTGWKIYERFQHFRYELLTPVFLPHQDVSRKYYKHGVLGAWVSRFQWPWLRHFNAQLTEALLPDALCYVPKKRGYFTTRCFADCGAHDMRALGCDEYLWQGQPFAFHVRKVLDYVRRQNVEVDRETQKQLQTAREPNRYIIDIIKEQWLL